ncbi:glycoside hydrolase family 16 protein [Mucilaginibacter sp.]
MKKRLLILSVIFLQLFSNSAHCQVFYDDFKKLDTTNWIKMDTKWGEKEGEVTQGGVVPDNVYVKGHILVVQALGSEYKGSIKGHGLNTRVGGVLSTKHKYASGRYEVRAKLCPQPGALSAIWTFFYLNDNYNHEIDFEFPGHNQFPNKPDSSDLRYGLLTNWTGVASNQYYTADTYFGNQTDGKYHTYRFDWHSGGNGIKPRVEYYFDDKLLYTSYDHVPFHAGNFNVGIWFPRWIKKADFDKAYMYVNWVKITPFNEPNDVLN